MTLDQLLTNHPGFVALSFVLVSLVVVVVYDVLIAFAFRPKK